jgi:hypothetical protein
MEEQVRRRAYLSSIAVSGLLAGCISDDSENESGTQNTSTPPSETEAPTEKSPTTEATESSKEIREPTERQTETEQPTETPDETEPSPMQPKIREVQDNFGNTFTFDDDSSASVQVDDEIVVSDETEIELCVTDVDKHEDDDVMFSYWFGNSRAEHPNNTAGDARLEENCRRWDMKRDDYSSHWGFSIWIRNEDEIYYQNDSVESDYRVVIHYNNLKLDDDSTESDSDSQPKIREVQDNFGNTFTFDGDSSDSVQVDDEIVVNDETEVELCVTEVDKSANDDLMFSYWFGNSQADHPDNTTGDARLEENCRRWGMQQEDYSSHWGFSIWIKNDDEIYYQNDSVESDYRVVIHYNNLTLED